MELAIQRKWQRVVFEIDSKELQYVLTKNCKMIDWKIRPIVLEIQRMLELIPNWKLNVVKRSANAAADWLAVQTRLGMSMSDWRGHLPFSLVGILNKDGLPAPPS